MDSSKGSKPRKGIRGLLEKLGVSRSRSRSRSPSQSSQQPGHGTLAPIAGPSKGAISTSKAGSSAYLPSASPGPINTDSASVKTEVKVPSVAEPNSECGSKTIAVNANISKLDERSKNAAWAALRTSLRFLYESSRVFPPLSSAVGVILSCIDGLETGTKHREDYQDLAATLCAMVDSLNQNANSMLISGSVANLVRSLAQEATEIQEKLGKANAGGIRDANIWEEEVLRHYRRVQSLFQQLQTNASMSTWRIVNEQLTKSRLDQLNCIKQAEYDSDLSAEVSRRSCTQGTRTTILSGLHDWMQNPSSASVYWMNGMAGTGKTTIAYSFCEQVEKRKQLAAGFFCTRNNIDCRNTSRIIPTIAYQLARYSIPYQSALCEVLGQNPDIGSKHIRKQFEQLLIDPLQRVKSSFPTNLVVVIDALDECSSQNGVALILEMLFRDAKQVPLKFLITSRPEPEIFNKMRLHEQSRAVIRLHDIEQALVRADIELYLKEELAFMAPTHAEIEQLAHRSGCLFIYAATLARYILYSKRVADPRQRLQSVLSLTTQSKKKHAEIDALYTAVLESALQEAQMEDHEADDIKAVLRTVLLAQEPIDVNTIAVLGQLDDPNRVLYAIQPLRSVIYQSEETGLVSTLHASFPDFLLSFDRSGVFFCNRVEYNQLLAQRCFGLMKAELKFNICALESSFVPDKQVDDLQIRIKAKITPTLAYVCQHWANHLGIASKSDLLLHMLDDFLSHRLLFWMEIMSLRQIIDSGIDTLQKTSRWIKQAGSPVPSESLIRLLDDSLTFVTNFAGSAALPSTPHIYISSLPFCSRSSEVYKHYWSRFQGLLELKGSLIDYRDSAALTSWKVDKFVPMGFSSDGTQVIGGVGDTVMILNVYHGVPLLGPMLGHTGPICACTFSSDGSRAVSAAKDSTIRVWDTYNGTLIFGPLEYNTSRVRCVTSPEADIIDVPFEAKSHYIKSLSFSTDYTRIIACFCEALSIYLLDASTGALIAVIEDPTYWVHMVAMSPDGTTFASASADVRLWSAHDGTSVAPAYTGHGPSKVKCVTFTPDGTRIVSGSHEIHVWLKSNGSLVAKFGTDLPIYSLTVSPDGIQVASGSSKGIIQVWKTNDGTILAGPLYARRTYNQAPSFVGVLVYTPDGTRLISCTGTGTVAVWPVQQGVRSQPHTPPIYPVKGLSSMAFSAKGTHVITRDLFPPKATRKWDVQDGSFGEIPDPGFLPSSMGSYYLPSPNGLYAVTVTEDTDTWSGMKQVIRASDSSIILGPWPVKLATHQIVSQFSPDSTKVAIGFHDGTVVLWDLQTREVIAGPFTGHNVAVYHVALSPDSSLIASSGDQALSIFNVNAPLIDIAAADNPKIDLPANPSRDSISEGWKLQEDGWVVNGSSQLLFYVPLEFRSACPSPHTSLIIVDGGTVQVPKQTLYVGETWHRCYKSEFD